jgi:hypothetical protein
MAAESLIVTSSDGTTDLTFYKVSQNAYASRFAYDGNDATNKRYIDIDHKVGAIGSLASDVHTVTYRHEALDPDTQRVSVAKVSFQVAVPKGDSITVAMVGLGISYIASLFRHTFMLGFVLGQTPTGDFNVTGPFNPPRIP